jgi:hypothetical protein
MGTAGTLVGQEQEKNTMTPVGRAMAVTLGVAALAFSLAACSSDGWLIKNNGADDVSTIGLFTECTDGDNCCSLSELDAERQ